MAWFISSFHNYSDSYFQDGKFPAPFLSDVLVNLSSIPEPGRVIGEIGLSDFFYNYSISEVPADAPAPQTVLFCDPQLRLGSVEVEMSNDGSVLTFKPIEPNGADLVGNINQTQIAWIIGHGLNGIPWDSNVVTYSTQPNQGYRSSLSLLAAELLFLPPVIYPIETPIKDSPNTTFMLPLNQTVYSPNILSNISSTLNLYTSLAGMNMYLSGDIGNFSVPTTGIYTTQRLVISWPQWFANLSIVLIITALVIALTIRDVSREKELVPLTMTSMERHLSERHEVLDA